MSTETALPTTTACPICLATGIPADGKYVHYCTPRSGKKVISPEYIGYYDGQPINYGPDCLAIATELDHYVTDLLRDTAIVTADMDADAAAEASTEAPLLVTPVEQLPDGWMRMPEGDILDADGMRVSLPDLDGPVVAGIVAQAAPFCRACHGQHHIQHCPEIRKLLYAPITRTAIERSIQTSNLLRAVELGIITPEHLAERAA